jgi:hypothetical protein
MGTPDREGGKTPLIASRPKPTSHLIIKENRMKNWKHHFKLKDLLSDEDKSPEEATELGMEVAERLRRKHIFGWRRNYLISEFECIHNQEEFNDMLDRLYDIADELRIWIE